MSHILLGSRRESGLVGRRLKVLWRRELWRKAGALLLSAALLPVSSLAAAQEKPETEALLRRGIQLRRDGADEAALAIFLEAEAQSPDSVRVLLHVATAAQAAGKWLMADEYLKKAAKHESDPYYQRYKNEIDEVRAATAQRVGQFRAIGEPEGAEVRLNGDVIGTLPMESPKSVEAGTYVLEVTKSGFYRLRRPISVPGGVLTRETVALNPRTAAGGDGPNEVGGSGAVGIEMQRPQEWWAQSWVTWSLLGVGIAGGATSGVALYLRDRSAEHWNDDERCLNPDAPELSRGEVCGSVREDIDTAEQVAIIGGVTGAVFTGLALAHWIATSNGTSEAARSRSKESDVSLQCAPGFLNVACAGTF